MEGSYLRFWIGTLAIFAGVDVIVIVVMGVASGSLIDSADNATSDGALVILAIAQAINSATWWLTWAAGVAAVGAQTLLAVSSRAARNRGVGAGESVKAQLAALIASLNVLEQEVDSGTRVIENAKEEKERLTALLSTSSEQLRAIEATVAPGAGRSNRLAVLGLLLTIVFFIIDMWVNGRLF